MLQPSFWLKLFQSLVGVYGFSRRRCFKRLIYLVFKVHLGDFDLKVPFQPSVCQYPIFQITFKLLFSMGFSHRGNRFCSLLTSNPCSVCITASKFNNSILTPTDSPIFRISPASMRKRSWDCFVPRNDRNTRSIAQFNQHHQSYPETDRTKAIIIDTPQLSRREDS